MDFVIIGETPDGLTSDLADATVTRIGAHGLIRSHTVIYAGNVIGEQFRTGHATLIRESNQIGASVSIGSHSIVEHHVRIGNGVRIHSGAFIPEFTILEDECWIGPHACLTNAQHPRCPNIPKCLEGAVIRRGAKIGANATILPGIEVGEMALVAAGAVVTENVPARMVVAGVPARVVKCVDDLICPHDQLTYPYRNLP